MIRKSLLCLAILGVLVVAKAPAAEAQTQYWPKVGFKYTCFWRMPNNNGESNVIFAVLNGNNYYRWGYMSTTYPNGGQIDNRVVVTKPVSVPYATQYEFNTNTQIQCTLTVHSNGILEWFNCSNGAIQVCF